MVIPGFDDNINIKGWAAALALFFFTAAAYFNAPKGDFIWDDKGLIFNDWAVQQGGLLKYFEPSYLKSVPMEARGRFRPMRAFFFGLDYRLYGQKPAGYHVTNLLLHFSCSLLLFFLALKLGLPGPAALFAALLFAVHPAHTESVTWIKNRSDLIAAFFVLASFYSFLSRRDLLAALLFLPALLAKEIALCYPVVLGLFMLNSGEEKPAAYGRRLLPFALMAGLFLLLTSVYWRKEGELAFTPDAQDHFQMIMVSLGFYVKLLFAPWPLKAEHEFEPPFLWGDPYLLAGLASAGLIGLLWIRFRKSPYSFCAFSIFACLLPVLNLHYLPTRLIAEQRVYLASVFFCLLAGLAFARLASWQGIKVVAPGAAALLVCFAGLTYARNKVWMNDGAFWRDAVRQNPGHYRANLNLGLVCQSEGDYQKAYEYVKKASEGWDAPNVFYSLGFIADRLGKTDEAAAAYENCLSHGGERNPDVYNNLAIAYSRKGDAKKAELNFRKAIEVDPKYVPAYFNLAGYYRDRGNAALAAEYERKGAELRK